MTRSLVCLFAAFLFLFILAETNSADAAAANEKPSRPNFLVILCDDLGYGDLACYGNKTIRTPHLDRLAKQGMRLTACYSAAPVCSPSRAGMMTGRTPSRLGVYDWIPGGHVMHLAESEITVAALLKKAGYETCHSGKWHLNGKFNSKEQPQPGDHGFDHWFATQNNASPSHRNPRNFVRNGKPVGATEGFACQIVADETIRWLESGRDKSKPFFAFVCFHEPHEPIDSPEELVKSYPAATKRGEALYYANVTNMDRAVGSLMEALDRLKLADDTVVFFTSDNGPETLNRYRGAWRSHGSPGPLRGMKLHLYEGGIRVPGILRYPGRIKPGQEVATPVCGLDVLPTLCELAGVEPPRDRKLDGQSVADLIRGKSLEREKPLYWHYYRSIGQPKAALRKGDYMILGHWSGPQKAAGASLYSGDQPLIKSATLTKFELYNLKDDLAQKNDLAESQPEKLAELKELLVEQYKDMQREARLWKNVRRGRKK